MMTEGPPNLLTIHHDAYRAKYLGRTEDDRQFFLTTPFVPGAGTKDGREFIALYLFDSNGHLTEALIDDLGPRQQVDNEAASKLVQRRLEDLGKLVFENIAVVPFSLEQFGVEFGLVATAPEKVGEEWCVISQPGNYMFFYAPWDGDYDT